MTKKVNEEFFNMHKIRRNILKKIYFNIEKEEKWLNNLSKKGLNLVDINSFFLSSL